MSKVFSIGAARDVADREDKGTRIAIRDELGEPLIVKDGNGNEVPAYAVIVGRNSATFRRVEQQQADRMLRRRSADLTAEMIEQNELEKIAACVREWNLTDNGKPIPCDKSNVVMVLRAAPWIRREFETTMADPSRFLVHLP